MPILAGGGLIAATIAAIATHNQKPVVTPPHTLDTPARTHPNPHVGEIMVQFFDADTQLPISQVHVTRLGGSGNWTCGEVGGLLFARSPRRNGHQGGKKWVRYDGVSNQRRETSGALGYEGINLSLIACLPRAQARFRDEREFQQSRAPRRERLGHRGIP